MPVLTFIARVMDGLLLVSCVASVLFLCDRYTSVVVLNRKLLGRLAVTN